MKTAVSSKGQVTIPKAIRRRLGLTAGTRLHFHESGGRLIGEKVSAGDPFGAMLGLIKTRHSSERLLARVQGR